MDLIVVVVLGAIAFIGGLAAVIGLVVWLMRSDRTPHGPA